MKYEERLQQSAEEKEKQDVQFLVEEARGQLTLDKAATKRDLSAAKRELDFAKSSMSFDSGDIIRAKEKVESLERGLKELEMLEDELF